MRRRAPGPEDRSIAFLWGATALAALLLRGMFLGIVPSLPACPWRSLLGIACPGCGSGRAAVHLLEGHVVAALAMNPLLTALGVVFLAGGLLAPLWVVARGPLPAVPPRLPLAVRIAAVGCGVANWTYVVLRELQARA